MEGDECAMHRQEMEQRLRQLEEEAGVSSPARGGVHSRGNRDQYTTGGRQGPPTQGGDIRFDELTVGPGASAGVLGDQNAIADQQGRLEDSKLCSVYLDVSPELDDDLLNIVMTLRYKNTPQGVLREVPLIKAAPTTTGEIQRVYLFNWGPVGRVEDLDLRFEAIQTLNSSAEGTITPFVEADGTCDG